MKPDDDKPLTPAQARQKLQKGLIDYLAGNDRGPIAFRLKRTKKASETYLKGILEFTTDEVVSSDFIHSNASSIFDAGSGIELNSHFFKLISWYDNEWGYSQRCVDLLKHIL